MRRVLAAAFLLASMAAAAPAGAATFGPAIPLPAGGFYMGLGDLNFDGKLDMVQTHFDGSASVYTGDGDGTFTVRAPLTVGTQANDAVIADFTTDNSKQDIAVINFGSRDVSMFENTTATAGAAPTFNASGPFTIGAAGSARNTTAAADFDSSGALDLAVPTFTNNQVSVLLGNGEALLGAPFQFATTAAGGGELAAAGSLNGDSKPDLVVANFFTDNVSALLNTTASAGTATFAPKQDAAAGDGARAVAIGDLNGDANGDVAVSNENAQSLSVLIGNGDGTFDAAVPHAIGTGTAGVAIGDLDDDGKNDIVVSKGNGAGVFRGNGNGTFQPIASLAGAGSSDVDIADVNNDLKPDIVTDSQVFLNTTTTGGPGPGPGGGGNSNGGGVLGVSAQSALPPPQARKTANVAVVRGTVKVRQPGQGSFRPLSDPAQIRMGSVIDATKGRVRVTTDAGGGKTQTAEFYDGIFRITQTKGKKPITDLTLVGKLAGCKKGRKATVAARKRKGRRLWGSGKGRFRTRGKRSSALVRGTIWLVEDRCDGTTFTRVRKGVVQVRDFGRKRNITVRAGRTYTARARRR